MYQAYFQRLMKHLNSAEPQYFRTFHASENNAYNDRGEINPYAGHFDQSYGLSHNSIKTP